METESVEASLERLLVEYVDGVPAGPLAASLSLKDDLAIESLSLVALTLRFGQELGVDVAELGVEFGDMRTFGDLVRFGHMLRKLTHQPATEG